MSLYDVYDLLVALVDGLWYPLCFPLFCFGLLVAVFYVLHHFIRGE